MKKSIIKISVIVLVLSMGLVSCNTPAEKVEKAQENVIEANKNLDEAQDEYLMDVENYRKETDLQIAENDQRIADFKLRIEHDKKEVKDAYNKRIEELQARNREMKKKMDDYKADGKENWENFKANFKQGMDDIGTSLKDLTEPHSDKK